jgi:hypothetical protein
MSCPVTGGDESPIRDDHPTSLRTGVAELTDPDPPTPSRLRTRAYHAAFHELAHLAA